MTVPRLCALPSIVRAGKRAHGTAPQRTVPHRITPNRTEPHARATARAPHIVVERCARACVSA